MDGEGVWVTRPEHPKGTKDEVKQARRVKTRPKGPPARSWARRAHGLLYFHINIIIRWWDWHTIIYNQYNHIHIFHERMIWTYQRGLIRIVRSSRWALSQRRWISFNDNKNIYDYHKLVIFTHQRERPKKYLDLFGHCPFQKITFYFNCPHIVWLWDSSICDNFSCSGTTDNQKF